MSSGTVQTPRGTEKHNPKDAQNKQSPEKPLLSSRKELSQSKPTPKKINCTELQDVKSIIIPDQRFILEPAAVTSSSDQLYLQAHTHTHEWELQMEQLNHAEEGLSISPPASFQTPLPAGLALALTCCQLALLPAAERRREFTPSRWSRFRHSSLLCHRADDRDTETNSAPASPACTQALCALPSASPKTTCPPSAPFSSPNGQ